MITHQPVNNHDDLLKVVDGLLEEAADAGIIKRWEGILAISHPRRPSLAEMQNRRKP